VKTKMPFYPKTFIFTSLRTSPHFTSAAPPPSTTTVSSCIFLAIFIPSTFNSNAFEDYLRYVWYIFGFVEYLGRFGAVAISGWVASRTKWVVERSILQLCYGSGGQLPNAPFRNSFRRKYELRDGPFRNCATDP